MRKVKKGKPLQDATKGSSEYFIYEVDRSFRAQFGYQAWNYCIVDTFADHIILRDFDLPQDEYWLVTYTPDADGDYTFALQDQWEKVELAYAPSKNPMPPEPEPPDDTMLGGMMGDSTRIRRRLLIESAGPIALVESAGDSGIRRVRGIGMTAGSINENMRRYPAPVIADAVEKVRQQLGNPAGRIGRGPLLGEAEHPSDRGQGRALWLNTVFVWDSISFNDNQVMLDGRIVPTSQGQDALILLEAGVLPGLSLRGLGRSVLLQEAGSTIEEVQELELIGWDATIDPADATADLVLQETAMLKGFLRGMRAPDDGKTPASGAGKADGKETLKGESGKTKDEKTAEIQPRTLLAGEVLESAAVGLSADDRKRLDRLAESERRAHVAEAIDTALADAPYSQPIRQQIADAVRALDLGSAEAVPGAIERQRAVADAMLAQAQLQLMGRPGPRAPVISGGGTQLVPDYAKPQQAITDSLVLATGRPSKLARLASPQSVNERFAVEMLRRFDAAYKHHLIAEARMFQDAEQASDLALPYTIMRTVIAEMVPELIAVSVFDTQSVDPAPTVNIPYETYAGETGLSGTITDEVVVASLDVWVNLAHQHLTGGSDVLTHTSGSPTYVNGTDYVIDVLGGRLMALSGGAITASQSLKLDYTYAAIRQGEMVPIERGKLTLAFYPMVMAADRLATQISSEAMVFSRAVLGYDAVGRALSRIMFEVRRKIDGGLFYLALAEALRVASNSGGTWTAATDTYDDLAAFVGVAKVKVANRFFVPTAIIMSETNADRIANWIGFTAAGARPDADLNASGYVGRLKALPVFATTEFSDSYILALNREVVYYRVGQPMQLKGPYPSYDPAGTGKLIAADQYFVEEYNGSTGDPGHSGKAASVKIV